MGPTTTRVGQAVAAHTFGQGQAIYVGTIPDDHFLERLVGWLCEERGILASLDVPQSIEVTVLESDDVRFLFLLNSTTEEQRINIGDGGYDLIGGEVISGEVPLDPFRC